MIPYQEYRLICGCEFSEFNEANGGRTLTVCDLHFYAHKMAAACRKVKDLPRRWEDGHPIFSEDDFLDAHAAASDAYFMAMPMPRYQEPMMNGTRSFLGRHEVYDMWYVNTIRGKYIVVVTGDYDCNSYGAPLDIAYRFVENSLNPFSPDVAFALIHAREIYLLQTAFHMKE